MNKATLSKIGMAISAVLVLLGLLAMCGVFGGQPRSYSTAPYNFDSGYASFGGDYYTYSVNNAAEATDAAQAASSNARELVEFTKAFCGLFMMGFGALSFCGFGIVLAGCKKDTEIVPAPEEILEETSEITEQNEDAEDIAEVSEETEPVEEPFEETAEVSE